VTDRDLIAPEAVLHGADYAVDPHRSLRGILQLSHGRIAAIRPIDCSPAYRSSPIDLSGYLLLPGLVNAHDHLEFALYPKLGEPPYRNYIEWGEDIHARFADLIAAHHRVPREVRLWWGGLRNLLCGVTTVCHHNPLDDSLRRPDFPVRVVQQYGWAHSAALGGNLRAFRMATPEGWPFIVHACEGIDQVARDEARLLDELGILDDFAVLVHGLALDHEGVALLCHRGASLVLCPSSNFFLFGALPDLSLLTAVPRIALGSDSPLTATGDLLDEIRFAVSMCGIARPLAYQMVTSQPAGILRLRNGEGCIREGGIADLIAVRSDGRTPAERLGNISAQDIELVLIEGTVQLASESLLELLPAAATQELEPLLVAGATRWVRAPVHQLLRKAEEALGQGNVLLCGREVRSTICMEADHAS
jgi:cytosine/adenosine deaminase-related metal-dependent hydrolase